MVVICLWWRINNTWKRLMWSLQEFLLHRDLNLIKEGIACLWSVPLLIALRLKWISKWTRLVHIRTDDKRMQGQMDLARRTHAGPRDNARVPASHGFSSLLISSAWRTKRTKNEEHCLCGERLLVSFTLSLLRNSSCLQQTVAWIYVWAS